MVFWSCFTINFIHMGRKQSKRYVKQKLKLKQIKKVQANTKHSAQTFSQALISILKPALSTLVFLLVSTWAQHWLDGNVAKQSPCLSGAGAAILGTVRPNPALKELENKQVVVGERTLLITRHAAERMLQRGVTVKNIQKAVRVGKLFAYSHNGIVKIGYYDEALKVFLAVDKRHEKIITTIKNTSKVYVYRLLEKI